MSNRRRNGASKNGGKASYGEMASAAGEIGVGGKHARGGAAAKSRRKPCVSETQRKKMVNDGYQAWRARQAMAASRSATK